MFKSTLVLSLVTISLAIEGVINPLTTDELDAALRAKIDQLAADLEDLVELLNKDLDGKLFYRSDSRLQHTNKALENLVLELDDLSDIDDEDENVEVEIIEITEVEPDEDDEDEIEEIIEEEEEEEAEHEAHNENALAELSGRNNNQTIYDSKTRKSDHDKKLKTKLKASGSKKKALSSKKKLSSKDKKAKKQLSSKDKDKKHKTKLTTKKIIKKTKLSPKQKTKLSPNKKTKLSSKTKGLSLKETKNAMRQLNTKDAQSICSSLTSLRSGMKSVKGTSLRGLDGEGHPPKPNVASTIQQLTDAFNKLQSAIVQASRGSNSVTPTSSGPQPSGSSAGSGSELGPGVGNGEQSTISPQVASNIANVLHRMAAVSASTTSNPLDPIVKAAISVQGQAANALRGILPSHRV